MGGEVTRRILPREEWHRLAGTEFDECIAGLSAVTTDPRIVVTEDQGEIVGYLLLMPLWHAEGVWIRPDHRGKAGVFHHLMRGMADEARTLGVQTVFPGSDSDAMDAIVTGLGGVEIPMRLFALNVQESKVCLSPQS